jgi:hypothetical protein
MNAFCARTDRSPGRRLRCPRALRSRLNCLMVSRERTAPATPTVVAGDFNDNVKWDRPKKRNKHKINVDELAPLGLRSAYHHARGVEQGAEREPTIYWRDRKRDGGSYHIDYCFVPESWTKSISAVELGGFDDWVHLSDHVPLIVEVSPSAACPPAFTVGAWRVLADELKVNYPNIETQLGELISKIEVNDREIEFVSTQALPTGAARLRSAEFIARDLRGVAREPNKSRADH